MLLWYVDIIMVIYILNQARRSPNGHRASIAPRFIAALTSACCLVLPGYRLGWH